MSKLREEMSSYMELKGYSPVTITCYLGRVSLFSRHFKASPDLLGMKEVKEYLLYLKRDKGFSSSNINQNYSALKILYTIILSREWDEKIPKTRRPKKLPKILSRPEVSKLLSVQMCLKHHAVLSLFYTSGLRLRELINLKLIDINSSNMTIRVNQGKGNKDRFTILSKELLIELREYYKVYRPKNWLFEGKNGGQYGKRSIHHIFQRVKKQTSFMREFSPHILRHCFATHLLEQGVDIFRIKELLGHSCINTTTIYLHVSNKHMQAIKDPLEFLREV